MLDFTFNMYRLFCQQMNDSGYNTVVVGDYFTRPADQVKNRLFLRHDVDRGPMQALEMARIEKEMGMVSTYFFRVVPGVYVEKIIEKIVELGMEIGYHYETLDKTKGDFERAIELVGQELEIMRKLYPVKAMSMHGIPLSKFDNRDLWKKYDFKEYGIEVSAYLSMDFKQTRYLSDTGRTWHTDRGNIKDFASHKTEVDLSGTLSLVDYLKKEVRETCLLIHPNRWSNQPVTWTYNWGYDLMANSIKYFIKKVR